MAYTKTTWVNDVTELNAENMNNIEDGLEDVDTRLVRTYADKSNNSTLNYTSPIPLAAHITSGQKAIAFLIPFNVTRNITTVTLNKLNMAVRLGQGGYPYVRSGTDGATYTQLQNSTAIWENGVAVRDNEISSISIRKDSLVGFYVVVNFNYAICSNDTGTSVINNQAVTVFASFNITLS